MTDRDEYGTTKEGHHRSPASRTPRTPQRRGAHRDVSNRSPVGFGVGAGLSPPVSPPVSLSFLGMSPLSPLRPFSPLARGPAPSSPLYPHSDSGRSTPDHGRGHHSPLHRPHSHNHHNDDDNDIARDRDRDQDRDDREILAQRLRDLATRLSQRPRGKDEEIEDVRTKVDQLEDVLNRPDSPSKTRKRTSRLPRPSSEVSGGHESKNSLSWKSHSPKNPPFSDAPSLASPARLIPSAATTAPEARPCASTITVAQAEKIVAEARDLHKNLEIIISNLRDRQEETEHIHSLLITRLERAAQRILHLEGQIKDLESERKDSDREILNLQIQLKAIEVQCLSYVPNGADRELRESIDTWKMEISAHKQRRARTRVPSSNSTPTKQRMLPSA